MRSAWPSRALLSRRLRRTLLQATQPTLNLSSKKWPSARSAFDLVTFHKADMSFHRRIWASAQNEYLAAMLERVVFSLFAFELIERRPGDAVIQHVAEQHRGILNAIQTHDAAIAREEFTRIMAEFWSRRQLAFGASQ